MHNGPFIQELHLGITTVQCFQTICNVNTWLLLSAFPPIVIKYLFRLLGGQ